MSCVALFMILSILYCIVNCKYINVLSLILTSKPPRNERQIAKSCRFLIKILSVNLCRSIGLWYWFWHDSHTFLDIYALALRISSMMALAVTNYLNASNSCYIVFTFDVDWFIKTAGLPFIYDISDICFGGWGRIPWPFLSHMVAKVSSMLSEFH